MVIGSDRADLILVNYFLIGLDCQTISSELWRSTTKLLAKALVLRDWSMPSKSSDTDPNLMRVLNGLLIYRQLVTGNDILWLILRRISNKLQEKCIKP